jgi:hypothetical protein
MFQALKDISGATWIIDSSKYPLRGLALSMIPGIDIHFIHLIRDGRGVTWSMKRSAARKGTILARINSTTKSWSTPIEWYFLNIFTNLVLRISGKKYIRQIYERFVADPKSAIEDVCSLMGVTMNDWDDTTISGSKVTFDHMIGGNYVRRRGPTHLKLDASWIDSLTAFDQRLFWAIAGRYAKSVGYAKNAIDQIYQDNSCERSNP